MRDWKRPTIITEIRSFLGLAGYYRLFVENFSKIAVPLTKLTQKNVKFVWSTTCEKSFHELNELLTSTPVLTLPNETDGFVVYCDASRIGLGCVLMQKNKVIPWASPTVKETWAELSYTWLGIGSHCLRIEDITTLFIWSIMWDLYGPQKLEVYIWSAGFKLGTKKVVGITQGLWLHHSLPSWQGQCHCGCFE